MPATTLCPATTTTTTVLRDYTTTTTVLRYNTSSITITTTKLRQLRRQRQDTARLSQLQLLFALLQLCYMIILQEPYNNNASYNSLPCYNSSLPATTTTVLRDNTTTTTGQRQLQRQRQDSTKFNQLKLLSALLIPATNWQERYDHYVVILHSLECSLQCSRTVAW